MANPTPVNPGSTPKRLLSLDGGGIRGLMEAEVLIEIETQLNKITGQDRPLCDRFDLIGGTSTGSILAAGLAMGLRAAELRDFYLKYGKKIFSPEFFVVRFWHKYPSKPLEDALKEVFGANTTLGDSRLRTLLMIVSKNATLGSTWFFINNPANKYFAQNKSLPLWQVVRASSAAPTYFPPQTIHVIDGTGKANRYEFIDGGVSSYNNPSMQLFLEATEASYGLGWETSVQNLLLISLGTGFSVATISEGKASGFNAINWAQYAINELMGDANLQQNILMHLIGERPARAPAPAGTQTGLSLAGGPGMSTIGKMSASLGGNKLLTYQRMTVEFTAERLRGLGLDVDPGKVSQLDAVDQMANLQAIGQKIAKEQVNMEAVKGFFLASRAGEPS
jgi:uncharacterized protein